VKTEFALLAVHESPTITAAKVAEMLGITERTLENKIYNKSSPVKMFKLSSQYVAHVSDVAAYIDAQREGVGA
jgi:predicted DNA-binding transcriptional regulator AlpA